MKPTTSPINATIAPTFVPDFVDTEKETIFGKDKGDAGKNAPKDEFMQIGHFILDNYSEFSQSTFMSLSRTFDISGDIIKALFTKWVAHQMKVGRCELVQGCYDEPSYRILYPRNSKPVV